MIRIPVKLSKQIINRAKQYSLFREECKKYLIDNGINHDKFTITEFDSFLGYVSEAFIADYIRGKYHGRVCVSKWQDQFNLGMIQKIVSEKRNSKDDIELVSSYFYDTFDLYVSTPNYHVFLDLKIDVKTAMTQNTPQDSWVFLYPVVQARKLGKDAAVLVYYVADDKNDPSTLREIVLIGYLNETEISNCEIIKTGEYTIHGTCSRTDNYVTNVGNYHDISELFKDITIQ